MYGRHQMSERFRPFFVTAFTGCFFWCIGGLFHAYVFCPDWTLMGQSALTLLKGTQPLRSLMFMGLFFGIAIEIAKFLGAVTRSQGAVLLFPGIAGILIGINQGMVIVQPEWGFSPHTIFRGETFRVVTGAVVGLFMTYPAIMLGIAIRRTGRQW